MKRRTVLTMPLAALAIGFTKKVALGAPVIPDIKKESHQMALMLLLLTDLAGQSPKKLFFAPYNSATYPNTVFGKNGIDAQVFQDAKKAFTNSTTQNNLVSAAQAMRTQMKLMGIVVQNNQSTIYDPADPCPYYDANLASLTVKKLTA
jgi:hypothetical protein